MSLPSSGKFTSPVKLLVFTSLLTRNGIRDSRSFFFFPDQDAIYSRDGGGMGFQAENI